MGRPDVLIAGACRTPIGNYGGALSALPAPVLGGHVIREAVSRTPALCAAIEHVIMGQVFTAGAGQAAARQAARLAGLPDEALATSIGKVCGSGMEAIILGCQTIQCGEAAAVVAGGMESMSRTPYVLYKHQAPVKAEWKVSELEDSMVADGLRDASTGQHMGVCIEDLVRRYRFSRDALDEFAVGSYRRALTAQDEGAFRQEIAPIAVHPDGGFLDADERPRRFNEQKLRNLPPVFEAWGTVTAGNASGTNDGASAMVLLSEKAWGTMRGAPLGRVLGYARKGGAPRAFGVIQVAAVTSLLAKLGLRIQQIDLFEINEAFAAVPLAVMQELHIDPERVNVHGGAIALGHPIGASGARIVTTLLQALKRRRATFGIASICVGGGEGIAIAVEAF